MRMSEMLLPEFDHEMTNTRKTLERIPDDKLDWTPHAKSWSMGGLATHIANIPSWTASTIQEDSLDMNPTDGAALPHAPQGLSRDEILESFDKNVAAAREAIAEAKDEQLVKPWSLLSGGKTMFTLPRIAVLRSFVMNHSIHHRAQLGVYLRLNDVAVPATYGPSADEEL